MMKRVWFGLTTVMALALAWVYRFVQDDAFISFRYARNLARGAGLVYNPGERIEGYTNFLWTVCLTPAAIFGVDMVLWSQLLSLASFVGVMGLTACLARRWFDERVAFVALALVAFNYSFCSYATGGLETMFGIWWVLAAIAALGSERLALASLATAAAFMTRMDSSLLLFPFWLAAVFSPGLRLRMRPFAIGGGIILPLVAAWLFARHAYYGAWLPNTFLIKGGVSPVRGIVYIGLFFAMYGYVLAVPALLAKGGVRRLPRPVLAAVVLWLGYLVTVGGDFMEFRLFLPVFPLLAVVTTGLLMPHRWGRGVLVGLAILALVGIPRFMPLRLIQPIYDLAGFQKEVADFGHRLTELLGPETKDVKVAVTAAGVIPYLTDLPTLDLLGLNDRDVALEGDSIRPAVKWLGNRPGHCRLATWAMVKEKGTNLLIGHAWTCPAEVHFASRAELRARWPHFWIEPPAAEPMRLILWPMGDGRVWPVVYMKKHVAVEAAIRRCGADVITL